MFSYNPKFCCIDCKDNCGSMVKVAPANFYGCKQYVCCGQPCYTSCSIPLLVGVKNADAFISAAKVQVEAFKAKHGMPDSEMCIFECVSDNMGGELLGLELGGTRRA